MRTSPPRPYDPEERYPGLSEFRRTATRLHPRPGEPGVGDSSVGGPLLWPAGEPWPVCTTGRGHYDDPMGTVAGIRRARLLLALRDRGRRRGEDTTVVEAELAILWRPWREQTDEPAGPQPMTGVAQLYARDVPELVFPESADLLQVLWCPYTHESQEYLPLVHVVWRASGSVREPVTDPSPGVVVGDEGYVPQQCVVHPEPVVEYPPIRAAGVSLPPALEDYDDGWSLAKGWKAGGWGGYCGVTDPEIPPCHCGAGTVPLLTVGNAEWSKDDERWRPIEDAEFTPTPEHPTDWDPVQTYIGRGYLLQVFRCAQGFDYPPTVLMT